MEAEAETKVVERDPVPEASNTTPPHAQPIDLLSHHRLVGRYELVHRLGHGGMATVYLGRAIGKAGFERLVAVKVIHPHLASEPEFVEMFLDEARIAAKIHHPHVVEILDLGDEDDVYFMVMEYVEGDTLSSLLRQLKRSDELLPLPAVLQVIADACKGLSAAHDLADADGKPLSLVHRDVSPHNLLVSMDGRVKVVDFGIMKAAGKRSSTLTGQLRGKLAYMSPEQARRKAVDRRADLFALGAVMWELLANRRLFDGEEESTTLEQVLKCDVPKISELRDDLPASVGRLLDKALADDPNDRYENAADMLRDLRAVNRELDGEDDPRDLLAAAMQRFFSGRVEYIRATLRGSKITGRKRRQTTYDLQSPPSGDDDRPALASASASRLTHTPAAASQTLTTTVGAAPARSWTLWLLLPLVGAAIGTAAMGWDRSGDKSTPTPAVTETQRPSQRDDRDATPASAVAPQPERVKWLFNTRPQGATIIVDGTPLDSITPTSAELPRSQDALLIRIEKEGYKPHEMRLAPLRADNVNIVLDPIAAPTKSMPTLSARPRGKARSKPAGPDKGTDAKAATKAKSSDKREFASIPGVGEK